MKYFLDFEFVEGAIPSQIFGFNIPKWLVKPNNTIQPISVGIVAEDGREYYAISKEFNLKEAWNRHQVVKKKRFQTNYSEYEEKEYWLRDNVLKPIWSELCDKRSVYEKTYHYGLAEPFSYKSLKYLLSRYGKTNKEIALDISIFTHGVYGVDSNGHSTGLQRDHNPQFYTYYGYYDWVAFCWLFEKMINLKGLGLSMHCVDLKQSQDETIKKWAPNTNIDNPELQSTFRCIDGYPRQTNEHNALADARWNKQLHDFLSRF